MQVFFQIPAVVNIFSPKILWSEFSVEEVLIQMKPDFFSWCAGLSGPSLFSGAPWLTSIFFSYFADKLVQILSSIFYKMLLSAQLRWGGKREGKKEGQRERERERERERDNPPWKEYLSTPSLTGLSLLPHSLHIISSFFIPLLLLNLPCPCFSFILDQRE